MIARAGTLARLSRFIEAPRTQRAIVAVIIVNALVMGLETSPTVMESVGDLLIALDRAALAIFVVEIAAKLLVYRWSFFRGAWNVFDFLVVGVALVPAGQSLSVLRALRVLRVLRLVSMIPKMRLVVQALLGAIPAMGSVIALLALVYYVCAVMATKLFGPAFDAWFGTVGRSLYSLFQIMTLESWSMGIVRPVLEVYPYAWVFFVAFILVTSFAVLNLFIAIIVNSMHDAAQADLESRAPDTRALIEEIRALRREVEALRDERR
jgi:voltage-gated sodium channel